MTEDAAHVSRVGRIEDLYVRCAPGGFRLAYLLTGDRQAAEDCVQEASSGSSED
jgi:DNA-directed RNA polymerase specialized sigma24 family protein